MKEKELIFVIPDLRIGGTQRNLIFLINFLIRKEFNIKIIIFDSKKHNMIHLPSKIKIKNLNLYKESKNIFQKIYFNLYRIKKIRSEIKDNKKAIIISFLMRKLESMSYCGRRRFRWLVAVMVETREGANPIH